MEPNEIRRALDKYLKLRRIAYLQGGPLSSWDYARGIEGAMAFLPRLLELQSGLSGRSGMDRHSLVAHRLCVDAAKDDYRLRPNLPAFKLCFKPIPVEQIGCYQDALRASWPLMARL